MTGSRRGGLLGAAVLALAPASALAPGCSSNGAECDCVDPGITIDVPADIASSVGAIRLSGAACTGASITITNMTNGGTEYRFDANAAGTCNVEVDSPLGTFTDAITIVAATGCCSGFYASPISAAVIEVPELGDAG